MAEFPALPLFTDAYLADTRHLTAEEHGAYLLLLMCAWRTRGCALKDCDRTLARIVGVTRPRWRRLRPVLAEFFEITGGQWRQKKLTQVYKGVESRVAKNRANGAKGGRAKASRGKGGSGAAEPAGAGGSDCSGARAGIRLGIGAGIGGGEQAGEQLPAKAKTQNQSPEPEAAAPVVGRGHGADPNTANPNAAMASLLAAARLDDGRGDSAVVAGWFATGASLEADMLPTIRRIASREVARMGQPPASLAYYSAAILEARDSRVKAVASGQAHADAHPPAPEKRAFNPASEDDWRAFLGDASSRFRGDYLSQNWAIGRDHPVFLPAHLGPDPRDAVNDRIPPAIMAAYGPLWRWRNP